MNSFAFVRKLCVLTIGGGAAFWLTTIATSLLPIAAEYRAAYSNWSVQTVWIASLFIGMIVGGFVSYSLLRYYGNAQKKDPILKAVTSGAVALMIAVILIDVPLCFQASGGAIYYLLLGVLFNAARFLILGFVIGCLYKRLYGAD